MKKIVIVGAGAAAEMVANEILNHSEINSQYNVLGFVDDTQEKSPIASLPILGTTKDLPVLVKQLLPDEILLAIPSASRQEMNAIFDTISDIQIPVRIIPGIYEIIRGEASLNQLREIEINDLLGREEIGLNPEQLAPDYQGKTVLITGAGGSIGSALCTELQKLPVKKIIALGRGENSIHRLMLSLNNHSHFQFVIADIRNPERLKQIFKSAKPDIVFHAAAHKHVPFMEDFPVEAVINNIFATESLIQLCSEFQVQAFVLISTDKAVNASSVMGATKSIAERLVLSAPQNRTNFRITRFGNVMGSRGSVVEVFQEQIRKNQSLTVTDSKMTRFFMSIREAARLVIQSVSEKEGNLFILDMGEPLFISDLARKMIRLSGFDETRIPIRYTGIRPGEKLNEELYHSFETPLSGTHSKLLRITQNKKVAFSLDQKNTLFQKLQGAIDQNQVSVIRNVLFQYSLHDSEEKEV